MAPVGLPKLRSGRKHARCKRNVVTRCAMTTRALRAINMRPRLEDVFADAERCHLGLKRQRCIGNCNRQRTEFEVGKQTADNRRDTEQKTEHDLAETAVAALFRHLESLLRWETRDKGRLRARRMF